MTTKKKGEGTESAQHGVVFYTTILQLQLRMGRRRRESESIPSVIYIHKKKSNTDKMPKKKGQNNYSNEELDCMLTLLEQHLPCDQEEWQLVLGKHNSASEEWWGRDVFSLKRKYQTLHRKKTPTGDPNCPPNVRRAKRIHYRIKDKCEIGDVEEEINIQGDFLKDGVTEEDDDDDDEDDEETRSALTSISTNIRTVAPAAKRAPLTPAKRPYTRYPDTGQVVDHLSTLVQEQKLRYEREDRENKLRYEREDREKKQQYEREDREKKERYEREDRQAERQERLLTHLLTVFAKGKAGNTWVSISLRRRGRWVSISLRRRGRLGWMDLVLVLFVVEVEYWFSL